MLQKDFDKSFIPGDVVNVTSAPRHYRMAEATSPLIKDGAYTPCRWPSCPVHNLNAAFRKVFVVIWTIGSTDSVANMSPRAPIRSSPIDPTSSKVSLVVMSFLSSVLRTRFCHLSSGAATRHNTIGRRVVVTLPFLICSDRIQMRNTIFTASGMPVYRQVGYSFGPSCHKVALNLRLEF